MRLLKYLIFILLLTAIYLPLNAQESDLCFYCKKPVGNKYLLVDGKIYHPEHFLCAKCNKRIEGSYIKKNGKYYHPGCYSAEAGLVCGLCGKPISGEYILNDGQKYHKECYENNILPKCSVCGLPLNGIYTIDSYGNKYHSSHLNDLPKCDCCERLISKNTTGGGKKLADGRNICNICYPDAVFNQNEIERALDRVEMKLISMYVKLDTKKIRIIGVDRNRLREVTSESSNKTQGYCSSKTEKEFMNDRLVKQTTTHTIYVLTGLTSVALESVIAHELMHSWLYDNTSNNHSDKLREGACNYISYLYLLTLPPKTSIDFIKKLENNTDPVYGGGFRELKKKFEGRPLNELLSFLKN